MVTKKGFVEEQQPHGLALSARPNRLVIDREHPVCLAVTAKLTLRLGTGGLLQTV
jgi:hypothetical protein